MKFGTLKRNQNWVAKDLMAAVVFGGIFDEARVNFWRQGSAMNWIAGPYINADFGWVQS